MYYLSDIKSVLLISSFCGSDEGLSKSLLLHDDTPHIWREHHSLCSSGRLCTAGLRGSEDPLFPQPSDWTTLQTEAGTHDPDCLLPLLLLLESWISPRGWIKHPSIHPFNIHSTHSYFIKDIWFWIVQDLIDVDRSLLSVTTGQQHEALLQSLASLWVGESKVECVQFG